MRISGVERVAEDFGAKRGAMVQWQLRSRGITDERVLAAMEAVPRHRFVPDHSRYAAYDDCPLPIGQGQTISQPYIIALMCQLAEIGPGDRVLEVGAGSGYQAAILGKLAQRVIAIELLPKLADGARARIAELGYDNVEIVTGDGSLGYPALAPYQAIVVAAQTPSVPPALVEQLAPGGRLVMPLGDRFMQTLTLVRKTPLGLQQRGQGYCVFVPLRSASGSFAARPDGS